MLPRASRLAAPVPTPLELVALLRDVLAWLVVPAVALVVHLRPERLQFAAGVLAAVGVVVAVARRPDLGLLGLVVGVPFHLLALSHLYASGVPATLIRPLGVWKEAVVAGCVLAAVRAWRSAGHRPDAVDWLAGGYLAVVGLYYAFPGAFVAPDGLPGGPVDDRPVLNVALRTATTYVVLLIAVRHLDLGPAFRDRFARAVFLVGVAVAAVAIFEMLFSDRWNSLMVDTFEVLLYKLEILGVPPIDPVDVRVYGEVGGTQVVRIGSVLLDQLECGLALVAPLAVGLHRLLRGGGALVALGLGVICVALIGTQTRGALLAAVVAAALVLRPHAGVDRAVRARVGALALAGALALLPVAAATGLLERTFGGSSGDAGSSQEHLERSRSAFGTFLDQPFGRGLGTGANTATRFDVEGRLLSENYYLLVANETGLMSVAFLLPLLVVAGRRLGGSRNDGDLLAAAWRGAFVGLSLAGLFLYVWEGLAVAWTVWIGVGLVLSAGPARSRHSPTDSQASRRSGSGSVTSSEGRSKRMVSRSPAGS